MNKLVPAGNDEWELPHHAQINVYTPADGNELLTIYDCGAAQKPPTAQLLGNLVRIDAEHERLDQPTGYIAKLREKSQLEQQGDRHWVVRATE